MSGCTSSATRTVTSWCTSTSRSSTSPSVSCAAAVIGDEELADAYLTHVAALEEGVPSTKPFHACPAMDVPQVYVYANDGDEPAAASCRCATCTARTRRRRSPTTTRTAAAGRSCRTRRATRCSGWSTRRTCARRCRSPPAGGRSDRVVTEAGDLYHACRYLGLQPGGDGPRPVRPAGVRGRGRLLPGGGDAAGGARPGGRAASRTWPGSGGSPPGWSACGSGRWRCCGRRGARLGWTPTDLPAAGFAPTWCSPPPRRAARPAATVPLGLPVWVLGADPGDPSDGVAAAAPCGSCR